jgi:hypothetical protein
VGKKEKVMSGGGGDHHGPNFGGIGFVAGVFLFGTAFIIHGWPTVNSQTQIERVNSRVAKIPNISKGGDITYEQILFCVVSHPHNLVEGKDFKRDLNFGPHGWRIIHMGPNSRPATEECLRKLQ